MIIKFENKLIDTDAIYYVSDVVTAVGSAGEVAKFGVYLKGMEKPIYALYYIQELNKEKRAKVIEDLHEMRDGLLEILVQGKEVPDIGYSVEGVKRKE